MHLHTVAPSARLTHDAHTLALASRESTSLVIHTYPRRTYGPHQYRLSQDLHVSSLLPSLALSLLCARATATSSWAIAPNVRPIVPKAAIKLCVNSHVGRICLLIFSQLFLGVLRCRCGPCVQQPQLAATPAGLFWCQHQPATCLATELVI
jgi:hypothetical protein